MPGNQPRETARSIHKMATTVTGVFREELRDAILRSKVLVVGAGGIGCEILKNLVMSGFADIEIVSGSFPRVADITSLLRAYKF